MYLLNVRTVVSVTDALQKIQFVLLMSHMQHRINCIPLHGKQDELLDPVCMKRLMHLVVRMILGMVQ